MDAGHTGPVVNLSTATGAVSFPFDRPLTRVDSSETYLNPFVGSVV
jgi:hypothetical protein